MPSKSNRNLAVEIMEVLECNAYRQSVLDVKTVVRNPVIVVVISLSTMAGSETGVGVARCNDGDSFNVYIGKDIAAKRAMRQIAKNKPIVDSLVKNVSWVLDVWK